MFHTVTSDNRIRDSAGIQYDPRQPPGGTCPICGQTMEHFHRTIIYGICNLEMHIGCVTNAQTQHQALDLPLWSCLLCEQFASR